MPLGKASDSYRGQFVGTDHYNWCVENWGTKWDVADAEVDEDVEVSQDALEASFSFRCWTAWGPPVPVWDNLHQKGVTVEAEYQDEGGMFVGEYINGKNKSWVPSD